MEDEGKNGLEAVSGTSWRDKLLAQVPALRETPCDNDYF